MILPNVSYCEDNNEVHYNPFVPPFFCKLTLSDDSVVELEGSGELTQAMVSDQYKGTLVSAEIGDLCTSIGTDAFLNCRSLTSVTIPDSVTFIGGGAFYNCVNLSSVTFESETPCDLGEWAFHEYFYDEDYEEESQLVIWGLHIYVPSASVNTYKTSSINGWYDYASIIQAIPTA
jgi:hypothetical protein